MKCINSADFYGVSTLRKESYEDLGQNHGNKFHKSRVFWYILFTAIP